ncbi:DUF3237 domain-containing protein [Paenibacillus camelliae]|uniref:DUF3237 domain-containing protein n=1 Tax=Paenibacillus camelliae TaxID=512410 RepID=UPI00204215D5|nr:DUF3237 domain-containing protein [Paenibacillus camelliae]MCM3633739.1 DUF3237 domain-containing protein [Paenibacillus camelliae]
MIRLKLEHIFTVHVRIDKAIELKQEEGLSVVMITFGGTVTGPYFEGEVLEGGVDTQIIGKDTHTLSARYMLKGKDHTGNSCTIYVENNGHIHNHDAAAYAFRTTPKLITDSPSLSFLNEALCVGEGIPTEIGIDIVIRRWV